jgi:integrase
MNTVQPIRSKEQIRDIANFLQSQNRRDYMLFIFGIYTGLRISDILPLKVRDVRGKNWLSIREIKTGKEKLITLENTRLRVPLKEYTKTMADWEYLFPSRHLISGKSKDKEYKQITRQRAYQILNAAITRFGMENIGTHTLRKTFGYHFYNDTKNIAYLQSIFNHASPEITLRYIGIDQDGKDKLVSKLSLT